MSVFGETLYNAIPHDFTGKGHIDSLDFHSTEHERTAIRPQPNAGMRGRSMQGTGPVEEEGDLIGHKSNFDTRLTLPAHAFATVWNNPNNELLSGNQDFTNWRPNDKEDALPHNRHPNVGHAINASTADVGMFGAGAIGGSKRFMPMDTGNYIGDLDISAWGTAPGWGNSVHSDPHVAPGVSGMQGPDSSQLGNLAALNTMWNGAMSQTQIAAQSKQNFMQALLEMDQNA